MNSIDSEPVRFYLEHRHLIEQWAALKKDMIDTAAAALTDVVLGLMADPPEPGLVPVEVDPSGYGIAAWARPHWLGQDQVPRAAVGMGWAKTRIDFTEDGERAWTGIWRGQSSRGAQDPLTIALRDLAQPKLAALNYRRSPWDVWPVYSYVPSASDNFWEDLRIWNDGVAAAFNGAWNVFSDVVEQALHGTDETPSDG